MMMVSSVASPYTFNFGFIYINEICTQRHFLSTFVCTQEYSVTMNKTNSNPELKCQ